MARVSTPAGLRRVGIGLALMLANASPARPAQHRVTPDVPPPVAFPTSTELVQLDAVVTDENDRQVTDLAAEDFEIVEGGKRRPVTHFRYVAFEPKIPSAAPSAAIRVAPPRRETTERVLAIVLDDLSLSFAGEVWARKALHRLVDQRIGIGDMASIVRTGGGIGNLQQFTNDKRLLAAAIDGVRFNLAGRGGVTPSVLQDLSRTGARQESQAGSASGRGAGPSPGDSRAVAGELSVLLDRAQRARQIDLALGALTAVEVVIRALGRMPGRKALLFVSEGFAMTDETGDRGRVQDRLRALTDAAHGAAVVIYTMDPIGLRTFNGAGGGVRDQILHAGLTDLADQTGGLALLDSNDLDDSVARVFEDQKGYYLIGYQPESSRFVGNDAARRLHRVKLTVKKRGLRVRSRRGFYARSEPPQIEPRATGFLDALFSPFPAVEVPVRLTSVFNYDRKRGSQLRCLLHIDANDLTLAEESDGQLKADLEAGVVSISATGRPAESDTGAYAAHLTPEAAARARRNGLLLTLDLPARAGPYQIRAAVRDKASGRAGSAQQFVDVPDVKSGNLAISGVLMSGVEAVPSAVPVRRSDGAEPGAARPADPNVSPAVRRFRPGSSVAYAFAVYNARRERPSGEPRLNVHLNLYRDGVRLEDVAAGPLEFSAASVDAPVTVGGVLRLGSRIEPGDYTLEVIVLDAARGAKGGAALQWIDFEVTGA